jgi:ribosome biogenesis GTPase / thiamine phosphate phosphatase
MKAIVYKSTGSWYVVKDAEGNFINARMPGKFKLEGITSTNPVSVGDVVTIEMEDDTAQTALITAIDKRKNYINRVSPSNRHKHHIIAANLDQSLLFATLKAPKTSQGFLDRFLITAEAYHVPAIIVFNKLDLYKTKELEWLQELTQIYEAIPYRVLAISVQTGDGMQQLFELLHGKTTLLSGHSGVGKSSFINALFPQMDLRTQDVSGWSGKGLHTTTFAEMFDLPQGGCIIDTPGIRELGIADIGKQELAHYFPEMRQLMQQCRYNNCMHINEPGCAIKQAVNDDAIHPDRYVSYLSILDSIQENKY